MKEDTKGVESNVYETIVQTAVLNCIDSLNEEILLRNIPKLIQAEARIYDKRSLKLEGANQKADAYFALKVKVATYNSVDSIYDGTGKPINTVVVFDNEVKIQIEQDEIQPGKENTLIACNRIFMIFMRECIGTYTVVQEQRKNLQYATKQKDKTIN